MNYRSISDLNEVILKKLNIIPRNFDLIVGIPRSGMLPANLIALYLNKPFTDLHSFINGHIYKVGERGQFIDVSTYTRILVVDDSIASGSAIKKAREQLKAVSSEFEICLCAIYVVPGKEKVVDYCFETLALPRFFQWNIFHHPSLDKACFDIDGVLCVDPLPEQNDDGPHYLDFIQNATPLYLPSSKVGAIVSSRLEKYRTETEIWLHNNHVKYDILIMLDLPTMKDRQRANNHASHKAGFYKSMSYNLMIESSLNQAIEINRITGKPVFCTENFSLIFNCQSVIYNLKSGKYFPQLRKFALWMRDKIKK